MLERRVGRHSGLCRPPAPSWWPCSRVHLQRVHARPRYGVVPDLSTAATEGGAVRTSPRSRPGRMTRVPAPRVRRPRSQGRASPRSGVRWSSTRTCPRLRVHRHHPEAGERPPVTPPARPAACPRSPAPRPRPPPASPASRRLGGGTRTTRPLPYVRWRLGAPSGGVYPGFEPVPPRLAVRTRLQPSPPLGVASVTGGVQGVRKYGAAPTRVDGGPPDVPRTRPAPPAEAGEGAPTR